MIQFSKVKLICSSLLISASSLVYAENLLANYKGEFDIINNQPGIYYTTGTMTVDNKDNVFQDPSYWLHITMNKGRPSILNTGHITSFETTRHYLNDKGYKGLIEAELKFTCQNAADNLHHCKRAWPAFWLWSGQTQAEIDIAEFRVNETTGDFGYSNHIIHAKPGTDAYSNPNSKDFYMRFAKDYGTTDHTTKYGLRWDCDKSYNQCKLDFLKNSQITATKTISYAGKYWERSIIDGFRNGYQIVFTQHYNSEGAGKFTTQYNNYNSSFDMIVKSLTITP